MAVIRQLAPHVADLIAAGEVVERPASVVKELLENAVDAGARRVTVEIQRGGMTLIRVTDDGCGMAPEDAETAFLRHATSKIRAADDLAAITTMGFRGEALAAIASVSRVDLLTRAAGAEGVSLRLEAGTVTERGPAGCPRGTTIVVRDLFCNTPARMKFMKSDSAEGAAVFAVVQQQALSHPEVAVRFLKDGREQLSTPGDGDLHAAIYCIYGRQAALELVEVESRWEKYTLRGFVTKPTASRSNRSGQHFFVGGRPVRSRLLSSALEQAYRNRMLPGRFPACVLHLELPPHMVDVNVHPAKTEVRFLSEREAFDAVHYGVLGAVSRAHDRPELKLGVRDGGTPPEPRGHAASGPAPADRPAGKAAAPSPKAVPKGDFYRKMDAETFREFAGVLEAAPKTEPSPEAVRRVFAAPKPGETLPLRSPLAPRQSGGDGTGCTIPEAARQSRPPENGADAPMGGAPREAVPEPEPAQEAFDLPAAPDYRVVGEVLDTYIIVEQAGEVLFLDKHAAHERILFERLKAAERELMPQLLLAPIPVRLGPEAAAAVLENRTLLREFGFEADAFGGGSVAIRQIPADLDETQAEATLAELAARLLEGRGADPASLRDGLLHTIACKAAIKAGWHTSPAERDDLARQVLERDDIRHCPHGRPVCVTLTRAQLERQFKRT